MMRQKAYSPPGTSRPRLGAERSIVEQELLRSPRSIKIEQPSPQVVYVPTYNPAVVYGPSPAPSPSYIYYPSMYAYPPGYVAGASSGLFFLSGASAWRSARRCGAAATGNNGNVYINNNNYNNFNNANINNVNWQHNAAPSRGRCRTGTTRRGRNTATSTGRRRRLASNSVDAKAARVAAASMIVRHCRTRPLTAEAGGAAGNRDLGTHVGGSATRNFDGAGGGRGGGLNTGNGSQAHDYSNRGNASMGNRSFSSGGGAARGGGGMARGGGRGRR